jgi:hypothetical protein
LTLPKKPPRNRRLAVGLTAMTHLLVGVTGERRQRAVGREARRVPDLGRLTHAGPGADLAEVAAGGEDAGGRSIGERQDAVRGRRDATRTRSRDGLRGEAGVAGAGAGVQLDQAVRGPLLRVVKLPPTNRFVPSVARALTGPPAKLALNVLSTLPSARQNAARLACAAVCPSGTPRC